MSTEVTWWLTVSEGDVFSSSVLLTRKVEMAHLPLEGDMVEYLASEEEPDGAISGYIRRRHWDVHGNAHITFQQVIVDPATHMPEMPFRTHTYWWTDRDGDPWEYINRSGWKRYEP